MAKAKIRDKKAAASDAAFNALYPFESHWHDLNGQRYHYLDEGPRDAPVLIMLHGNPTWSFYYRNLIIEFREKYRVIVPDHIGCGLSDKPRKYAYTLTQHIQNLETLIAHLGLQRIVLLLHDWGGAIGMGYAVRHPENVAGFVVFNTAAFFVDRLPKRIAVCRIPILGEYLVRRLNGFVRAAFWFATSQRHRFTDAVKAGYLLPYNNWRNRIAIYRFIRDIPLEPRHPSRPALVQIEAGLAQFRQRPMLILWGDDDFCFTTADFVPRWREYFPQADVHILPNAGHYVVEDALERIVPLMWEFLKQLDV